MSKLRYRKHNHLQAHHTIWCLIEDDFLGSCTFCVYYCRQSVGLRSMIVTGWSWRSGTARSYWPLMAVVLGAHHTMMLPELSATTSNFSTVRKKLRGNFSAKDDVQPRRIILFSLQAPLMCLKYQLGCEKRYLRFSTTIFGWALMICGISLKYMCVSSVRKCS